AGLEEIEETMEPQEDGDDKAIIKIFGAFEAFGDLSKALEEMDIKVSSAKHERIANTPIDLTDEQMEEVEVLIDKLEDDEDVQAVYTNIN
ncbi:MAG TPA: YebC/PmpR family DNA-binding transcriptional regulator, partial [Sulfurovum sp.]|nr:YebC/PmpR family DNA-binding transcriptional regulator [Sulfurovum sp.]